MIDVVQIQKILPHRFPFLLVDRVTNITPNESLIGYKNVTIGEQILEGHFPVHPIYPGVMILEGMAQAGGILAFQTMDI
ncbi:MAG: 3-hydroxyacyl-[acyl-carrier-protein] dehydratase FabZ, partial [Sulfuricurvum sp.]|nr:3-hydroxyacyl-[acyl-carrier-protein] dehydratase FabZ [Sulfuricurvum sp.]